MDRYPKIKLYIGAASDFTFDFTDFAFGGGSVLLTIKDLKTDTDIYTHTFSDTETITIGAEITADLEPSGTRYAYDLMLITEGGDRYPQCLPSPVAVYETVGGVEEDPQEEAEGDPEGGEGNDQG